MTATKIYSWFWFKNKPINYNPKILPRSQNATPIIRETTALYGIKKDTINKYKCRIGNKPIFHFVDFIESLDIDDSEDFKVVNYLINLKQ